MASALRCDVCGSRLEVNLNESNLVGRYGPVATLCTLHHAAGRRVAVEGKFNWRAMNLATLRLNKERPQEDDPDEKWVNWEPLDRLVELYQQIVAEEPQDWPPP